MHTVAHQEKPPIGHARLVMLASPEPQAMQRSPLSSPMMRCAFQPHLHAGDIVLKSILEGARRVWRGVAAVPAMAAHQG